MDKRTILAIVLSVTVILIYQMFFMKPPVKEPAPPQETAQTEKKDVPASAPPPTAPSAPTQIKAGKDIVPPAPVVAERFITVDTPLYSAQFTTKGGALHSFKLKGYRQKLDAASEPIEMVDVVPGMPRPLTVSFPGSSLDPPGEGLYESDTKSLALTDAKEPQRLVIWHTVANVMKIEKIFTFYPDRYAIDMEVRTFNLAAVPLSQNASINWNQYADPKEETDSWSIGRQAPGAQCDVGRF